MMDQFQQKKRLEDRNILRESKNKVRELQANKRES